MHPQRQRPNGSPRKGGTRHDAAWRRRRRRRQNAITLSVFALVLAAIILVIVLVARLFKKPAAPGGSGSSTVSSILPNSGESSEGSSAVSSVTADMDHKTMTKADLADGDLILVNFDNSYMEAPPNLVPIYDKKTGDYSVKNAEIELRDYVITYLNEMMADFRADTGITNVVILSSYRSVEYQEGLYTQDLARTGRDYSDSVTKPGYSEHHTGLTCDLAYIADDGSWPFYDGHGDYGWINKNSWKYGFIVRYPEDKKEITKIIEEPWHFRYLGPAHAEMITKAGLCLEEYMDLLKKHPVEDPYTYSGESGSWSAYYVPLTGESVEVPVPKDKPYTISGSNEGGFIVTVDESGQA